MDGRTAAAVVILEDEALVAVDLEDHLRDAGFQVAATFSSNRAALGWFRAHSPDVVVMDIELQDGDCIEIAQLLYSRNVPFVVHSASVANSGFHHPIFLKGEWVAKPCLPSDLIEAVRSALTLAGDVDDSQALVSSSKARGGVRSG